MHNIFINYTISKAILICLGFGLTFGISFRIQAQDTHYWSNQFGARASLLGGAVIAGLDDNSAVFYNPANLAFIKQSTISLNTSVYKYEDILLGNGGGNDVDLKSQKISLYQQMVSGLLTKNPQKRWRLGFNILARQNVNIDMNEHYENWYDIVTFNQGPEYYIANLELRNIIGETWGCLGAGFKLSEKFSVGLTTILTYRSHKHTFYYSARALAGNLNSVNNGTPISIATNTFYLDFRSNFIGAIFKLGFHARLGRFRLGLNISSPSITLWGESRIQREDLQTNIPNSNGNTVDKVRTDDQRQLRSIYKYPLSSGLGLSYLYKNGSINFSCEYFMRIQEYKMIDAQPSKLTIYDSLKTDFLTIYMGADDVFNFALGWEHQIIEKLKVHLGFRSDFSFIRTNKRLSNNVLTITSAPVDLWHTTLGFSWRRKQSTMSIGLKYTYGHLDEGFRQLINFTEPLIQSPWFLLGQRDDSAYMNIHGITVMIGYTYYFALK